MILRLTFAARITLITLVSLIAVWIVAAAINYQSVDHSLNVMPDPKRLSSLATLVEKSDTATTTLALAAIHSPSFNATENIEAEDANLAGATLATAEERRPYAEALGDRPLEMVHRQKSPMAARFPRLFMRDNVEVTRFKIGLLTGRQLVVDVTTMDDGGKRLPIGIAAGLFSALIALGALLVMQRETRPLTELAAIVDGVDLSGPPPKLPSARGRAPEIRALINAVDRLHRRLDSMMRSRMALLGGISHDIRTFTTRLRLRIDYIGNDMERERAATDIDDMIHMLDDMILASRANAAELNEEMIDVNSLLEMEYADRRSQGMTIEWAPSDTELIILGDRLAVRRIIANATDNAMKYAGSCRLSAWREQEVVVIAIDDDGPGIPLEKRELMLEPFTRIDASRSRGTGGAGLGLAIIRNLVEAHHGGVELEKSPLGGARVAIRLPIFHWK